MLSAIPRKRGPFAEHGGSADAEMRIRRTLAERYSTARTRKIAVELIEKLDPLLTVIFEELNQFRAHADAAPFDLDM